MPSTPAVHLNSLDWTPFKRDQNIIKSSWNNSIWNRKQVRIRVEASGELSVQVIAQNIFARLASTFLKFLSRGQIKSFGKKVISFTQPGYLLPKLDVPLSEKKQKDLFDIQTGNLALALLPSHKRLNDLGTELCNYALDQTDDPEVMEKVLDMHQEIINMQLPLIQELQQDISPADLYKKIQAFEAQAQMICEQYPLLLKEYIQTAKTTKEALAAKQSKDQTTPLAQLPAIENSEEIVTHTDASENTPLENELIDEETTGTVQLPEAPALNDSLTPQQKYSNLLTHVQHHIQDLTTRCQFTSAAWLQNEMEKNIALLSLKGDDQHALKQATESLEDALDSIEQHVTFVAQLSGLPEGSPLEKKLIEQVITEIQENLKDFKIELDGQQGKLTTVFQVSKENPWLQSLKDFFAHATSQAESLAKFHDSFESWIPGLQTTRHFINPWLGNQEALKSLETLDRHDLVKHHATVESFCKKTLAFIENEAQIEKILQLRPVYDQTVATAQTKSAQLIKNGQYLHLARLENAQKTHATVLEKARSSLSSSSQALQYAVALKTAHDAITYMINEIDQAGDIDPIQQLIELKKLASPHYDTLHQLMVTNGKTQLNAYIAILTSYQTTLNAVIPVLTEQNNENLEQVHALNTKISSKIAEAHSLTIDYTVRLHVWQIFSSPVAPNNLPPTGLHNYLEKVTDIAENGIAEIIHDAANAGFKFN